MTAPPSYNALMRRVFFLCLGLGCSFPITDVQPLNQSVSLPAQPQRAGDAAVGYYQLTHGDYIRYGIPFDSYVKAHPKVPEHDLIPGREGDNAQVRYSMNVVKNFDGMKVAAPNCMSCHGHALNGEFILGLGRPSHFTTNPLGADTNLLAIQMANNTKEESDAYLRFLGRLQVSVENGPFNTFASYASHRDVRTLEWSATPHFDGRTGLVGWVDIPPLWRAAKKTALYANGMGRGDFVGHFMNMSIFSVENLDEAKRVERMFEDIGAFLRTMKAPPFPGEIDETKALSGQAIFEANCQRCHGSYGENGSYPTLLVPVDEVGTDAMLARNSWVNSEAAAWFNESFFGKDARMELQEGYVAPPLDGIWATAPFLHNGSVPNLDALLDSSKRPPVWTSRFADYDFEAVGWTLEKQGTTVDTRHEGLSKEGHTYGDFLSPSQRAELIEYLKTL